MPDVPNFAEGWGTSIVPCPYCDGFEGVARQHWGLIWSGPAVAQSGQAVPRLDRQVDALRRWSRLPPDIRADLARRNIPVIQGRITEIAHHGGHSGTAKLDTGPDVGVDILFAHPRNRPQPA
jgi:thioredoxin reductase